VGEERKLHKVFVVVKLERKETARKTEAEMGEWDKNRSLGV
jgi:hypothetical protein